MVKAYLFEGCWKLFAESPFCIVMHARLAKSESLWISPRPLDEAIVIRLRIYVTISHIVTQRVLSRAVIVSERVT